LTFHIFDADLRIVETARRRQWRVAGGRLAGDGGPEPLSVGRQGQDQSATDAFRLR
jgi:hypothetical protein